MAKNHDHLSITDVRPENFQELKEIVLQQAEHHECDYAGDDDRFLQEILDHQKPCHVILARRDSDNRILGYLLYSENYGANGHELYMEDLAVDRNIRRQGVGQKLLNHLIELAHERDCDAISWVVTANNTNAKSFYTGKFGAKRKPYQGYEVDIDLKAQFNAAASHLHVSALQDKDLDYLSSRADEDDGLSDKELEHIEKALSAPHTQILVAKDHLNQPIALLIANSNFSSFRTVYGYKTELVEISQDQKELHEAFLLLTDQLKKIARNHDHDGHLNIFIHEDSAAQRDFVKAIGATVMTMSNDPESILEPYGVDATMFLSK